MYRRYSNYGRSQFNLFLRCYANDVRFGCAARRQLLQGLDITANAVSSTFGPKGRNALIEQLLRSPRFTKNGVTVADNVQLPWHGPNSGAMLMRKAANNTNNRVGSGSSTVAILARSIAHGGCQLLRKRNVNAHQIRNGVLLGAEEVCKQLKDMSMQLETIGEVEAVASCALNGDTKLAGLIGDGINELGEGGVFLLRESRTLEDSIQVIAGITMEQGYISPHFANESGKLEYENALLLLTMEKIEQMERLLPAMELAKSMGQPLIIIAQDVVGEALNGLVLNHQQGKLEVCAVKAPDCGDQRLYRMEDLAIATGALLFDQNDIDSPKTILRIEPEDFGQVGEVSVTAKKTHFMKTQGDADAIEGRAEYLRELIKQGGTEEEVQQLSERLGGLLASVAIVYVGGANELEVNERKERLDNALNAVSLALSYGVVPGGGTAYIRCIPAIEELERQIKSEYERLGVRLVANALPVPCAVIAHNAGVNVTEVLHNVMLGNGNFGYDAAHGDFCDLMKRGIVDPTSVLSAAISDAAGIASLLATTEVLITQRTSPLKMKYNHVTRDLAKLVGM